MKEKLLIFILTSTLNILVSGATWEFQPSGETSFGEGNPITLKIGSQTIIKEQGNKYLMLELVSSNYQDICDKLIEKCEVRWTKLTPDRVSAGKVSGFIKYAKSKSKDGSTVDLSLFDGSDSFEIEGKKISWSYASKEQIYIYPEGSINYTTVKIEPATGGNG